MTSVRQSEFMLTNPLPGQWVGASADVPGVLAYRHSNHIPVNVAPTQTSAMTSGQRRSRGRAAAARGSWVWIMKRGREASAHLLGCIA